MFVVSTAYINPHQIKIFAQLGHECSFFAGARKRVLELCAVRVAIDQSQCLDYYFSSFFPPLAQIRLMTDDT
jgi:hypothetical protein